MKGLSVICLLSPHPTSPPTMERPAHSPPGPSWLPCCLFQLAESFLTSGPLHLLSSLNMLFTSWLLLTQRSQLQCHSV